MQRTNQSGIEMYSQSCEQKPEEHPIKKLKRMVGLTVECVPSGVITQFLNLHEVNALGRVNRVWGQKILVVEPHRRSYIDKACSFLVAFHVQKLLCSTSETHPWQTEKLFLLHEIGCLFNFKIYHFSYVHHFSWNPYHYDKVSKMLTGRPCRPPEFPKLNAQVVSQLKKFTELRSLTLVRRHEDAGELTDALFAQVGYLASRLEYLNINGISDVSLQALTQFTVLKKLTLDTRKITDDGLNALSNLTALQSLSFESSGITGVGLAALGRLTESHSLIFSCCQHIMIAHVAQLAHLTRLQTLAFKACFNIQDNDLIHLNKFTSVQNLSFRMCDISGQGLTRLSGLTTLRTLNLSSTKVKQESLPDFLIDMVNSSSLIIELRSVVEIDKVLMRNREDERKERRKMWLQHRGKAIKRYL